MFSKRAVLCNRYCSSWRSCGRSALAQTSVGMVGTSGSVLLTASPQPPRGIMPASFEPYRSPERRVSIGGSKVRIRL